VQTYRYFSFGSEWNVCFCKDRRRFLFSFSHSSDTVVSNAPWSILVIWLLTKNLITVYHTQYMAQVRILGYMANIILQWQTDVTLQNLYPLVLRKNIQPVKRSYYSNLWKHFLRNTRVPSLMYSEWLAINVSTVKLLLNAGSQPTAGGFCSPCSNKMPGLE